MANINVIIIWAVFICCVDVISGRYEDQAGKFDFKHSFIGKVKYSSYAANKIIAATEENVLACLNAQTGGRIWRQVLENEQQIHLLHVDKEIVTVSGSPTASFVRGWEIQTGINSWQWVATPPKGTTYWSVVDKKLIQVTATTNSIEYTSYELDSGNDKITKLLPLNSKDCVLTKQYFVCVEGNQLNYVNLLEDEPTVKSERTPFDGKIDVINFEHSLPSVLIIQDVAKIVLFKEDIQILPYDFAPNVVSVGDHMYAQLEINAQDRLIRIKTNDKAYDIEYPKGLGAPYISSGCCRNERCDLLLSTTDHTLISVRIPDGIQWTREEALANIVSVEFFELPVSESDVAIEGEFKTASTDIFNMFVHRISSQIRQLHTFILGSTLLDGNTLVRDDFGLHKIAVVVTKIGKLFTLDTLTGRTVWSYRLPHVVPFDHFLDGGVMLFVQRTARYAPLPAQCSLLAKDDNTGETVLFKFDPITGYSDEGPIKLGYKVKQAILLPYEDENFIKPFVTVDDEGTARVYPKESERIVKEHLSSIYLFDVEDGINGYGLTEGLKTRKLWSVDLKPSRVVALSMRPENERVHSQGRVLPDRSVYYKYVNPNLIALATMTDDPTHRQVLSIHLLDGITGLIIHSAAHKRARGPVRLIHSENWVVYTFFNERFRRTELVSIELYEGHVQSNSSVFSSRAVGQLPQVQSQSYILPGVPERLAVTLTERGITNKFVLVALSRGAVVEVPWALLQPRFDDLPCGPEETCYPYIPEIPLPAEAWINFNLTLRKVRGIAVAPTRLESTSHVLVYGLDLFYTRVAPSKTFDVLKEDFDHKLIVLVLAGLVVASYVTKHLASRKALKQAWK